MRTKIFAFVKRFVRWKPYSNKPQQYFNNGPVRVKLKKIVELKHHCATTLCNLLPKVLKKCIKKLNICMLALYCISIPYCGLVNERFTKKNTLLFNNFTIPSLSDQIS